MTDPHHIADNRELTEAGDVHATTDVEFFGLQTRATVERIIDGDTLVVSLRLPVHVRLKDCWAPERRSIEGQHSLQQLAKLAPVGSLVRLHVDTTDAKVLGDVLTFGRVVADIYRTGDDESVSAQMVRAGCATRDRSRR